MNAVAQALKKQVEHLHGEREVREGYIQFLEHHVARLLADLEYTESVGAAFAFDLTRGLYRAEALSLDATAESEVERRLNDWDEAIDAQREVTVDAKTWEAMDGL